MGQVILGNAAISSFPRRQRVASDNRFQRGRRPLRRRRRERFLGRGGNIVGQFTLLLIIRERQRWGRLIRRRRGWRLVVVDRHHPI